MAVRVTKKGQITLVIFAFLILIGGFLLYARSHPNMFHRAAGVASAVPEGLALPGMNDSNDTSAGAAPVYTPAQARAENTGKLRLEAIAWNAQIGGIFANGGPDTAPGSLMDRAGVSLHWGRQDMYDAQQGGLVKFAQEYASGTKQPTVGNHFVIYMGDASPAYFYGLQAQLAKYNLHAAIIGATGFSRGEDKCMGPPEWAKDPKKALGKMISAVIRDGDFNVCLVWAQINGLKINPDPKTYDPDAINFSATNTFTEADQQYIAGLCETRPVVGGLGSKKVCVEGVATWTPGDVEVVEKKGGVVGLLSTKENKTQMAAVIVGIREWMHENPATVTNFLQAALAGGVEVAGDRAKLAQAGVFSAKVWNEQEGPYWVRYYNGIEETDSVTGEKVKLGGSQAIGLASNLQYFLAPSGGKSVFGLVYDQFCTMYTRFYPVEQPSCPTDVVDTSFLEKIQSKVGSGGSGSVFESFTGSENQVVGQKSYSINFAAGSDTILPDSYASLREILKNATTVSNLGIRIEGYTSSEGGDGVNVPLSERRANAVLAWLKSNAPQGSIPENRAHAQGFGSANLVRDASGSEDAKASRRVVVKFTTSGN